MCPDALGHVGQHRRQVVIALDRDGRAAERGDRPFRVGERHQRVERADLRPGRHGRSEDVGAERPARVDHGLTAVHADLAGERPDGVVRDGQDDQLDLLDQRLRLGEGARTLDGAGEPGTAVRIATRHGVDRPTGTAQGESQRRADRAGPDDTGRGCLTRLGRVVRMAVAVGVDLAIGMAVLPGRDGVQVDAGRRDRGFGLGSVTLRIVTGKRTPGLHRVRAERAPPRSPRAAARARYACIHRV